MESKTLENKEVTNVTSYGTNKNGLVVETVASFGNMMNYKNTKTEYQKFINFNEIAIIPFEFNFKKSRDYKLVFSQTIKIILDGQEVGLTEDNFDKVLDRNKDIFQKILFDILKNSDDVGFTLKTFTESMSNQ